MEHLSLPSVQRANREEREKDLTDRYRAELYMRSEEWRHSTGFSHPPTSIHALSLIHTHTKSHLLQPNNIPHTHQVSQRQHTFTLQLQPSTSQYSCTPKALLYLNIHTVSGPHHACIIETHLARWLSPDIWLTKPVTRKPREEELNSLILLQKRREENFLWDSEVRVGQERKS